MFFFVLKGHAAIGSDVNMGLSHKRQDLLNE